MLLRITDGTTTYYTLSGDGSTILGCTYAPVNGGDSESVAETALVVLEGTETAVRAVEDGVESILSLVRQREVMFAPYFYVEYRPSASGTVYRSKLLAGKVLRSENPARRRVESSTNAVELTVVWERENFWEETTEQEIYLSSNTQTERTGGVTVYNNDNATSSQNWGQAAANRVTGQVEAPVRLRLANASGADRFFTDFYLCNNVWSDPANLDAWLLGSEAVGGATFSWTGAVGHTTDAWIFPLSSTFLAKTQGRYFQVLVAFSSLSSGLYFKASVGMWFPSLPSYTAIDETNEFYNQYASMLVAMNRSLPMGPGGYGVVNSNLGLKISVRAAATGSATIDFVHVMPADNYRIIHQNGYALANGEALEDNGVDGGVYSILSGSRWPVMTPYGKALKVWPGRINRFHFLLNESGGFVSSRQMTMQAWYRPRWRVV